jgi:ubiquitin-protein ligase
MVTTETQTLRNEFDNKIEALNKEHDSQLGQLVGRVQMLEKERDGLQETPHVQLSFFCRKWMERKPDALFDFVVYRKKSGLTTRLLCGIPGPKRTHWEGGLFPVLMTWFSDPDLPPMCEYPRNFHHVNVSPSGKIYSRELETWHRDISIPELLFSFQRQLAHPNLDSPSHEPAFRCYENNLDEYNEKTKELAEEYIREDFLRIASEDFILEPEEWILVNDMLGGGGMGVGVGIQVPTAHSPPAEPAIESRNTMGCSCSCCAWASSFWDGRREMLFLPVM